MSETHRIVIVGGGAGGLELATKLGDRYASRQSGGKKVSAVSYTHLTLPTNREV